MDYQRQNKLFLLFLNNIQLPDHHLPPFPGSRSFSDLGSGCRRWTLLLLFPSVLEPADSRRSQIQLPVVLRSNYSSSTISPEVSKSATLIDLSVCFVKCQYYDRFLGFFSDHHETARFTWKKSNFNFLNALPFTLVPRFYGDRVNQKFSWDQLSTDLYSPEFSDDLSSWDFNFSTISPSTDSKINSNSAPSNSILAQPLSKSF